MRAKHYLLFSALSLLFSVVAFVSCLSGLCHPAAPYLAAFAYGALAPTLGFYAAYKRAEEVCRRKKELEI